MGDPDETRREFSDGTRREFGPSGTHFDPGATQQDASYGNSAFPAAPPPSGDDIRVRFGDGPSVPPMWNPASVRRKRRSRLAPLLSIAVSLAIIAGVLFWIFARGQGEVAVSKIEITAPKGLLSCDPTTRERNIPITAKLSLNGDSGEVVYRWVLSDSGARPPHRQPVKRGETELTVPLAWKVTGQGRAKRTATLEVLEPAPMKASTSFQYTCR